MSTTREISISNEIANATENASVVCKEGVPWFEDLPDDATSLIFSFAYNSSSHFTIFQGSRGFFDSIFYLSKAIHKSAIYFLRNRIKHAKCQDIAVMCKYGATPKSIKFQIASKIDMIICLHILRTCNLSVLKSLEINSREDLKNETERLKLKVVRGSRSMQPEEFDRIASLSSESFQFAVADILSKKANSLSRMQLHSMVGKILPAIPLSCSNMLGDLSINGYFHYNSWKDSELIFSNMPRLRKLSIEYGLMDTITSESLEEIQIMKNFKIRAIRCPALKKLDIDVKVDLLLEKADEIIPSSVQDLSLTLNYSGNPRIQCDRSKQLICGRITDLRYLTRLRLRDCRFRETLNIIIKSDTLEHIDMTGVTKCVVEKCICPNLKIFNFACALKCSQSYGHHLEYPVFTVQRISNICLRPIEKFTCADFAVPSSRKRRLHQFRVADRKFQGLEVPHSCNVRIEAVYEIVDTYDIHEYPYFY
jgi:hypothetical protein